MFPRASIPERSPERTWRERLRRAVDLAVALATLEDAPTAPGHPDAPGSHPHRRPLRSPQRSRRPGGVPARVAHCTTPLVAPAQRRRRRPRGHDGQEPPLSGRLLGSS